MFIRTGLWTHILVFFFNTSLDLTCGKRMKCEGRTRKEGEIAFSLCDRLDQVLGNNWLNYGTHRKKTKMRETIFFHLTTNDSLNNINCRQPLILSQINLIWTSANLTLPMHLATWWLFFWTWRCPSQRSDASFTLIRPRLDINLMNHSFRNLHQEWLNEFAILLKISRPSLIQYCKTSLFPEDIFSPSTR